MSVRVRVMSAVVDGRLIAGYIRKRRYTPAVRYREPNSIISPISHTIYTMPALTFDPGPVPFRALRLMNNASATVPGTPLTKIYNVGLRARRRVFLH